jgi:hypothetical protein
MTMRTNRSMNEDLWRGAVDGKLRFLRPNAGGPADESHAAARANDLHIQNYGSMGISEHDIGTIRAHVPTSVPPFIGGQ